MAAFDTNVIMRVLVGDDPKQTRRAERAFVAHANDDGVYLSLVVLAEVGWVLAAAYEWSKTEIHARMVRLVRTRGVVVESPEIVEHALNEYASGKAGLADYLILGKSRSTGGQLLTFDKHLARAPDATLL